MGKHAAPDGSSAHPLVADALAHRGPDAPRHTAAPGRDGGLGWPGPQPGEPGVGWPKKDTAEAEGAAADEEPAPAGTRRGWRRFFRASSAA